jgi:penicillin-binding protein 1A
LYEAKASVSRQAVSATTAAIIATMLQRAVNEGTGTALRSRYAIHGDIAGKTGTSQDYSDAWFVGFTPGIVIGTWVGASDPSIHFGSANGTGGRLALPIAGSALAGIQRSARLRAKHMLSFPGIPGDSLTMDCDPRRSGTAVGRLLDGLFGGKDSTDQSEPDTAKKKGLFRQLFPKKGE